jgi:broad specificity phosphatase PhoE
MARIVHLIRHGHHAQLGRMLCGRMVGIELDDSGRRQMAHCAELIRPAPAVIQASPQRRALQSASIMADRWGLAVEIAPALDELEYGAWTGRSFAELEGDEHWSRWNSQRATSRPPEGESMRALQQRVVDHIEKLFRDRSAGVVAMVSHAEPIRAAMLHYAGIALDDFLAVDVSPASVSTLCLDGTGIRVTTVNQRVPA